MADNTKIEWADRTWNPLLGCAKVSPGCDNCYAIKTAHLRAGNPNPKVADAFEGLTRYRQGRLDWTGRINLLDDRLTQPMTWKKPSKIFVNSQSDLFHSDVPDSFIAQVFAVMAATPRHTYQILTKRHARMRTLLNDQVFRAAVRAKMPDGQRPEPGHMAWPLNNVWMGVSVEDQKRAELRIPALLDTPAAVRWLSCEPLLGPVDLDRPRCQHHDRDEIFTDAAGIEWCGDCVADGGTGELSYGHWLDPYNDGIAWVVVGGESGSNARPMHPDWARALRDQCAERGVPFFFKQWGEYRPVPILEAPEMSGGRAIEHPRWGGLCSIQIHEPGPSGTMRNGSWRPMVPGDRTRGGLVMLDEKVMACKVGKTRAGRELDGRTWDEFPTVADEELVTA